MSTALDNWRALGSEAVTQSGRRRPCDVQLFLLNRFQVGSGASSVTPAASLTLLGNPLDLSGYSGWDPYQIKMRDIYANESKLLATQATAPIHSKGIIGDRLVHVIVLAEAECNGSVINEIGLFVDNFFFLGEVPSNRPGMTGGSLGNSNSKWGGSVFTTPPTGGQFPGAQLQAAVSEEAGCLLGAYRQFPEITKESSFSLMFRWSIAFLPNC